jgi:hypothetical protein
MSLFPGSNSTSRSHTILGIRYCSFFAGPQFNSLSIGVPFARVLTSPAIGSPLNSDVLEEITDCERAELGRAEQGDGVERPETASPLAEIKVIHFLKHRWRRI